MIDFQQIDLGQLAQLANGIIVGGVIVLMLFGLLMLAMKARENSFGNPDRWLINEIRQRVKDKRRAAAVDAIVDELAPVEPDHDE